MTDCELLELAAKAAGIVNYSVSDTGVCVELGSRRGAVTSYWNPLTDDGDALRLAVKLGFFIYQIKVDDQKITVVEWDFDYIGQSMIFDEMHKDDPYAATRRAIVRAAAAIAKAEGSK